MRIRRDVAVVSSVLFTVALLAFVRESVMWASTWRIENFRMTEGFSMGNYYAPIGFASLTIYLVGLIVIWSAYVHRARWAWFAMLVIVWGYAFPVLMLPVLRRLPVSLSAWFWDVVHDAPLSRAYAKGTLVFLLMVVALLLPVSSFFRKQPAVETSAG